MKGWERREFFSDTKIDELLDSKDFYATDWIGGSSGIRTTKLLGLRIHVSHRTVGRPKIDADDKPRPFRVEGGIELRANRALGSFNGGVGHSVKHHDEEVRLVAASSPSAKSLLAQSVRRIGQSLGPTNRLPDLERIQRGTDGRSRRGSRKSEKR